MLSRAIFATEMVAVVDDDDDDDGDCDNEGTCISGRACHMLPRGAQVICYAQARVMENDRRESNENGRSAGN